MFPVAGRYLLLLMFTLLLSGSTLAQRLSGRVYDSLSGEPVQFANVYFAQTSIGAVTSALGYYNFNGFAPGKYKLTVSFIGYQTFSRLIEVETGEDLSIDIPLIPGTTELPEIYVRADNINWEENFNSFSQYFLGDNDAAWECEIMNPDVLYFYRDEDNDLMYAHASEPVHIRNKYLGYDMYFDLNIFIVDYKSKVFRYEGIPRYERLPGNGEVKKWSRNRKASYYGSMLHFFRSLHSRELGKEGYEVRMLFKSPNLKKLPEDTIRNRIDYLTLQRELPRKKRELKISSSQIEDSIRSYLRMTRAPDLLDSLGDRINLSSLLNSEGRLNYRGYLHIRYFPVGLTIVDNSPASVMLIREPVWIYPNGYCDDWRSIFIEGHWAFSDTISTMLPMDYDPNEE